MKKNPNSLYKKIGIYSIHNKINNKVYIGQTTYDIGERGRVHFSSLRNKKHFNIFLQNDFNIYGENNFEICLIEELSKDIYNLKELINEREIFWIAEYKEKNLSYNILLGGDDKPVKKGDTISEDVKRRIGEKNRVNSLGKKHSKETKKKMSDAHKGYNPTQESIDKMKESRSKNPFFMNDDMKENLRKINSGENNPTHKYSDKQVLKCRELSLLGNTAPYISNIMNIPVKTVRRFIKRESRTNI